MKAKLRITYDLEIPDEFVKTFSTAEELAGEIKKNEWRWIGEGKKREWFTEVLFEGLPPGSTA